MALDKTQVPEYVASKSAAKAMIREWRKTKKPVSAVHLLPGNFMFTGYVATNPGVYDKNPVIVVLRATKRHVLGINVNWLNRIEKKKLLDFLIKKQIHNKNRLQIVSALKALRTFKFHRSAYRLYFRKVLVKHRLYKLDAHEFYTAIMREMISKDEIERSRKEFDKKRRASKANRAVKGKK